MKTIEVREAAELLRINVKSVQAMARSGKLPAHRVGRKWLFQRERIEALLGQTPANEASTVTISARNRLRGTVTSLRVDGLMAEVVLRIGDQDLVSIITRTSAESLGLRVGVEAYALVKATEVMIGREQKDR
jgi:molybdopterin-binding protein